MVREWNLRWLMEQRKFRRELKLEAVRLIRDRDLWRAQASHGT